MNHKPDFLVTQIPAILFGKEKYSYIFWRLASRLEFYPDSFFLRSFKYYTEPEKLASLIIVLNFSVYYSLCNNFFHVPLRV